MVKAEGDGSGDGRWGDTALQWAEKATVIDSDFSVKSVV